jgi:TolB-like protein
MGSADSQTALTLNGSTQGAIRSQLNKVLSSSLFRESPAASRFLKFVVEAVLSGQAHHVKQYTIAVDAVGYPSDFDPQINPSIRVLAGRLRLMLDRYYLYEGPNDDIRIEIPKRSYIPTFRSHVPNHAGVHSDVSKSSSPHPVVDYGLSIAVIPFNAHLPTESIDSADSITDSIVTGLAQFRELHVVGPLEEYRNANVKTDEIAKRYHSRFILQGRVKAYGDTLRISAGLTDTSTGFKIWSQHYEYPLSAMNLLEIEDDVTRRVVSVLADYGGVIPSLIIRESMKKNPQGLEVHEAICSQMHSLRVFTEHAHLAAAEALEHAVKSDPDNPVVLAMLSMAYCNNYAFHLGPETATLEEIERLLRRAVALDQECQLAHISEAILRFYQKQTDQCIAKLWLARSLNPFNAPFLYISTVMLCMTGHWEEGLRLWEQAKQLNPNHHPIFFIVHFMDHYTKGDYETAWSYAERFSTHIFWDPLIRAATAGQLERLDDAKTALQELLEMRPDFPSRARELMGRFVYLEEHVNMLLDGLIKAGLKLNPTG